MSDDSKKATKVRIRKTAPTVRERAEAAQAEAAKPRGGLVPILKPRVKVFFSRLHLPRNKVFNALRVLGRVMARVLRWLIPSYFINSWREVRQVTWPSRKETWRLTLAVFIFALIFGSMVAGVDKGLDVLFKKVVLK